MNKPRSFARHAANWFALVCGLYLGLAYFAAPEFWTLRDRRLDLPEMVTRTPQGIAGDPINIGLAGTEKQVVHAFGAAGWDTADAVTLRTAVEIGESVKRAGFRKLVLLTSHGGNVDPMKIAARELRVSHGMLAVTTAWMSFGLPDGLFADLDVRHGIHGGDVETALMLHFRPDLVDMSRTERFEPLMLPMAGERYRWLRPTGPHAFAWMAQDVHPAGVAGDASLATAEKGKATAALQAQGFAELMADVARFPLAKLHKAD